MPAPFKTKKAALEALCAAPCVIATQIGGRCHEDWDTVKREKRLAWESQGYTVTEVQRNAREILEAAHPDKPGVAAHIARPVLPRVRRGTFASGSARYTFTWDDRASEGSMSDLKLTPNGDGLQLETYPPGVFIRYAIES